MATVISAQPSLPNDIEDELRAKNLSHFLLRNESKVDTIVIEVYENQAWHPVLQTWGAVVGVHLNAVLDRSPYTDESGTKVLTGSLAEVKPLNKYKWQGAWSVRAEAGVTDATGFQYAASWGRLSNKYKPSTSNSPLYYVRRRRFTRKMIVDPDPPSKALPYEITLKVLSASIQGMTSTTSSYVEIFLDRNFLDRTATTTPNWNHKLSKKIMEIDPEMTITFVLYSKKVLTIVNPFQSGPAPVEMIHRGTAHIVVRDFLNDLAVINREDAIDLNSPTGQKIGTISVRVDVVETRLFGVVPAFDDSLEELKKRTTDALPYDLRYNISTLDNDENAFLKVLVSSVIEGRDVLTETDLVDVVREASYLQGQEGDPSELGNDGKPKPHQQLLRYPSGKPRYGKLITLPSALDENKSDATVRQHFEYALRHEEALQAKNEHYDQSLPSVSSVFEPQTLAVNGYDSAYQPHQGDELKSDYYDLVIVAIPEIEGEPEPAHILRWTSYYDYVMMIAEMAKVQHARHDADTVPVVVRHSCKVLYGCQETPDAKPASWLPVTFTVDSEAEFLVIRESRVAREDQQDMFDLILAFDQVEGVIVKNTYHLSNHYILDLKVHSASSYHLRHTLGKLHVETTDGRQRVDFTSEAFRKGSCPDNQPGTVIFQQDSHTFLVPPSVLHQTGTHPRECLHVTFSSEENGHTDTPAVQGRMDLPLSQILPTMGTNVADCRVTFKNLQQQYELRLKVASISNLFWHNPAKDLFNPLELDLDPAKLFKNEEADPYYVVYFADENGQIIPLNGTTVGAASVVKDLAGNLVFLGTAGMVNNKGESAQSVVGNVAKDLLYLGTAGIIGGKEDKKKVSQGFDRFDTDNTSGHGSNSGHGKNIVSNVGNVASNLLHMGTGGMVGKKKEEVSQHGGESPFTPQPRSASTLWKQGTNNILGGLGVGSHKGALEVSRNGNNSFPTPPNPKQRPMSMNENKRQSMAGVTSSLMKVGQGSIQATSNVIVGTSNVAVNVLTLGNSSIVSSMNKADAVYQSNVAHKTNNPTWDEEIVLSTEKYGDVMRAAKFLLIEVWDKRTALADVCLGEVYVPVVCAHAVDPETPDNEMPQHAGHRKYPLQLSKHMKVNRAVAKRMPGGLGAMRAQLLYREACEYADSTSRERGDHDLIQVNFIVQMKPVGALDFAWPSRIISTDQTADSMEQDVLYVRLRHDGLHVSVSLTQPPTDRAKMLLECREKSNDAGLDKNAIHMVVPYDQVSVGEAAILTTDALMCHITLTRVVVSTTQKGKEVERPVTLEVLIGPCPATDVFAILNQRVSLTHFRSHLKAIAAIKPELDQLDAIGRDLQQDILAISHDIEDLSVQSNYAPILESLLEEKENASGPAKAAADDSMVIFADKTNRMSVTYFSTKLQVRVLMARQAFLKAYFWHVLEFSKFAVGKIVGKTVLPNFDKEIDIDAITLLTKRARATIKYGDPSKLGDGTDSDDSDEDEERVAKRAAKREVSTSSLVQRIGDIMTQLAKDVRALFFQGYRRKFTTTYCEFLASKLVYEQYLVIVGYLANILLDETTESQIPTLQTGGAQTTEKSLSSQMWHLTSVTTSVMTLGTVKLSTGNAVAEAPKSVAKKIDSQKKHDLISFVLSQDSLFEQYLHANLFACEYKFSNRPHLSMCLDFDVLIGKFADMLNDNIQMWNSKALKVFMCRKVEEGVAPSRLPWDITTMRDDSTNNEMYISHIPESIQIQLNVQIGMKKINTTGMGDNLSLMSIKRIYEINLKIAKAIARAYLALAVEYENFLEDTISALSAEDLNAGNRVTNMIQNVGMKMIDVSTLGMLNVAGEPSSAGQSARTQASQEESDELLCFLMSIVNDCTRINKEHIPQSVLSFVKEFAENGDAVLTQGPDGKSAAESSGVLTPGLTAAEEINGYFFNPIKAIKSVSRNAINCLTNQVFFHGDLREYFLRTFSDHMQVKPAGSGLNPLNTPLFSVKLPGMGDAPFSPSVPAGGDGEEEEGESTPQEEQAPAPVENPIATIVATLQDMYGFTASHVLPEDQHRIVHNCLKKLIMRYLIMLRDVLVQKNYNRMSVALNKGLDTGLKVGRTVLNITTLGLADHLHGGGDELDRSSSHHASQMTAESFTAQQVAEIREDLQTIMEAHLEVTDDSVAELLQFFNKAVNQVVAGTSCDPRTIDKMLLDRFHQTPPVYSPDLLAYDRALESFIGLNASTHELSHSEMETRMNKAYTIQFQDFTCIKLKDYRVCVVRVTFANITVQSSILASNMVGSAQIKWKDILRFEHVKGYQNKEVLVELVEIRPMGMRRELILARVRIQLSELSQFITPEPYPAATNGKIVSNPAAGHSGWFVLEEVPAEIYTAKGMTNMLRDVTLGTLSTTKAVTNTTVTATVSALMSPMRLGADEDAMGTSSTGRDSVGKSSHHTNPGSTHTPGASVQNTPAKARNNYLSILSSDQPREDVEGPQLKIRIRIVEEKE